MKANTISGQRQYAFVSQFNYIREAGTKGEEKAACRIEKELSEIAEKWGQGELQIRREPFEIETWQVDEAVFTVTEPYEKTYTVRGCFAAANTAPEVTSLFPINYYCQAANNRISQILLIT